MSACSRRFGLLALGLLLACAAGPAAARTLHVAPGGSDAADGSSWETAWRTPKRAFRALRPGDRVVFADGRYPGAGTVHWQGRADAPITVEARHPGRVVFDGGTPVIGWERAPGLRHVWRAGLPGEHPVLLLSEVDTFQVLEEAVQPQDCQLRLGCWAFDRQSRTLYVRTSTGLPPTRHRIEASLEAWGLHIRGPRDSQEPPRHLRVRGLAFKNFGVGAIRSTYGEDVLIEDCKVLQSAYGIVLWYNTRAVVRRCEVWATYHQRDVEVAGILFLGTTLDSLAEDNYVHDSRQDGIRVYGGTGSPGTRLLGNLVARTRSPMYFKGGKVLGTLDRNVVVGGRSFGRTGTEPPSTGANTVVGVGQLLSPSPRDLIVERDAIESARFVDPAYHDYRLQGDSPHRRGGGSATPGAFPGPPEAFFVGPGGSDEGPGTSSRRPWRTLRHATAALRPGQTLYLLPGRYAETLQLDRGGTRERRLTIRAHGRGPVVLQPPEGARSGIRLENAPFVTLENLEVRDAAGPGIALRGSPHAELLRVIARSNGDGIAAEQSPGGTVSHGLLEANRGAGIEIGPGSSGWTVSNNAFAGNAEAQLAVDASSQRGFHSQGNLFDPLGTGGLGRWGRGLATDLPRWRALSGQDSRSLEGPVRIQATAAGRLRVAPGSPLAGNGWLGATIGPGELVVEPGSPEFERPEVVHVGAHSAVITWETPTREGATLAWYGTSPRLTRRISGPSGTFHSISLADLEPDTSYYVRVGGDWRHPDLPPFLGPRHAHVMREFRELAGPLQRLEREGAFTGISRLIQFRTRKRPPPARTLYVSHDGDDAAEGTHPERAWRTLYRASREARPGDEVIVEPGVYEEAIVPVAGGATAERRLTFRSASWQPVILSGSAKARKWGIRLRGRSHVTFQGFHFREHNDPESAQVVLEGMNEDVVFRHCFFDGRGSWIGGIGTRYNSTNHAVVEDSAFLFNWRAITWYFGSLDVRHSVFDVGIYSDIVLQRADAQLSIENSVATSSGEQKTHSFGHLIVAESVKNVRSDHNRFYFQPYDRSFHLFRWGAYPYKKNMHLYQGPEGLERWRRETGNDAGTRIVEDPGFASYRAREARGLPDPRTAPFWLDDYRLAPDSPLRGAGRGGVDVGIRFPDP